MPYHLLPVPFAIVVTLLYWRAREQNQLGQVAILQPLGSALITLVALLSLLGPNANTTLTLWITAGLVLSFVGDINNVNMEDERTVFVGLVIFVFAYLAYAIGLTVGERASPLGPAAGGDPPRHVRGDYALPVARTRQHEGTGPAVRPGVARSRLACGVDVLRRGLQPGTIPLAHRRRRGAVRGRFRVRRPSLPAARVSRPLRSGSSTSAASCSSPSASRISEIPWSSE